MHFAFARRDDSPRVRAVRGAAPRPKLKYIWLWLRYQEIQEASRFHENPTDRTTLYIPGEMEAAGLKDSFGRGGNLGREYYGLKKLQTAPGWISRGVRTAMRDGEWAYLDNLFVCR